MTALTNPFDVLPANLFNLLSSQAGELQSHYMAILLRIYEMAEFNRFGLTREMVIAEIVDYLTSDGADGVNALADAAGNSVPMTNEQMTNDQKATQRSECHSQSWDSNEMTWGTALQSPNFES
ncbi:MAG: hypothetical protein KAX24_11460 [Anaerolineae bacterium]|nr:hypothetical protein [Anaerolineae bacterium]